MIFVLIVIITLKESERKLKNTLQVDLMSLNDPELFPQLCNNMFASQMTNKVVNVTNNQLGDRMVSGKNHLLA